MSSKKGLQLEFLLLGVLVAFCSLVLYRYFDLKKQKEAAVSVEAELEASRRIASVPSRATKIEPEPWVETVKVYNESLERLRGKLKRLRVALGEDKVGKVAQILILNRLFRMMGEGEHHIAPFDCASDNDCPMPIKEFYPKIISRVSTKDFATFKSYLQAYMVASNLPDYLKQSILYEQLKDASFLEEVPTSVMPEDRFIYLSSESYYYLTTHNQYFSTKVDSDLAVKSTVINIAKTKDPVLKKMLALSLKGHYPDMDKKVIEQFRSQGIL